MNKITALGIALTVVGLVLAAFPRLLKGRSGRFSLGILDAFIEAFPEKMQPWVARGCGVVLLGIGAWVLLRFGHVDRFWMKEPETLREWKSQVYESADYGDKLQTIGRSYSREVVAELKQLQPWYYYESPEPLVVVTVHPESYLMVKVAFLEVLKSNVPARSIAKEIAGKLEKELTADRTELERSGRLAEEIGKRQETYGPRILKEAEEAYAAAAGSTTMQMADASLRKASEYWQLGDRQSAVRFAQEAKDTRSRVLGPYHPKVKEIDQMIRAAGGQ